MVKTRFIFFFIFTCLLNLSCSPTNLAEPHCRVNTKYISNYKGAGACLINLNSKVLSLKTKSDTFVLPRSYNTTSQSAQCAAHNALWQQTGLNAKVEQVLGVTENGTWIFSCQIDSSFTGEEQAFAAPSWSDDSIDTIHFIDPFSVTLKEWHYPDDFVVIRDSFIASGKKEQK